MRQKWIAKTRPGGLRIQAGICRCQAGEQVQAKSPETAFHGGRGEVPGVPPPRARSLRHIRVGRLPPSPNAGRSRTALFSAQKHQCFPPQRLPRHLPELAEQAALLMPHRPESPTTRTVHKSAWIKAASAPKRACHKAASSSNGSPGTMRSTRVSGIVTAVCK